jgi:hypothetical protein
VSTLSTTLHVPDSGDLAELGRAVDENGLAPHLSGVRVLVRAARGLGVSPVLCQVALDPSAPEAVRERAVARLIRRVSAVTDLLQHGRTAASA